MTKEQQKLLTGNIVEGVVVQDLRRNYMELYAPFKWVLQSATQEYRLICQTSEPYASVENSSNRLIFMKKTGKKWAIFQLKNGQKTGTFSAKKRAKNGQN